LALSAGIKSSEQMPSLFTRAASNGTVRIHVADGCASLVVMVRIWHGLFDLSWRGHTEYSDDRDDGGAGHHLDQRIAAYSRSAPRAASRLTDRTSGGVKQSRLTAAGFFFSLGHSTWSFWLPPQLPLRRRLCRTGSTYFTMLEV
jgi:hypothetical protein